MPTITIRVSPDEKARIEQLARDEDQNVSEYVRRAVFLRDETEDTIGGLLSSVEQLWGRMTRLEKLAGLVADD